MEYSFFAAVRQLKESKEFLDHEYHVVLPSVRCCNNCAHCVERAATPGTPVKSIGQMSCDISKAVISGGLFSSYDESHRENDCDSFALVEQDNYLKEQWADLTDVLTFEDTNNTQRLDVDWWLFKRGTTVEDIWHYFDRLYSGGVAKLMHEI